MANLTIAIDDALLKRARIRAIEQGTSVNALLRGYLIAYVHDQSTTVIRAEIGRLARTLAGSSGDQGRTWTRDDLHVRGSAA